MSAVVFLLVRVVYVPRIRRKIDGLNDLTPLSSSSLEKLISRIERKLGLVMDVPNSKNSGNSSDIVIGDEEKVILEHHNFVNEFSEEKQSAKNDGSETPEMRLCFEELQAFSASFDAFAHGGNDVG